MSRGRKAGPVGQYRLGAYQPTGWPAGAGVRVKFVRGVDGAPDVIEFRLLHSRHPRRIELQRLVDHVLELRPLPVRADRERALERVRRSVEVMGPDLPIFTGHDEISAGRFVGASVPESEVLV